jgi:carbohydrate kinase (thermoresistant glucokinase family)
MVIIVMGVSGSGKTAVGEALAKRLAWAFEDADSWHPPSNIEKMHSGAALTDEDRKPWIQSLSNAIRDWNAEKRDVILACSALREEYRSALRDSVPDAPIVRFVFLKGTYEEIHRRLRGRSGHFMPESLLKSQFATLEEPDSSEALVVDIRPPVATIVDSIIARLHLHSSKTPESRQQLPSRHD